MNEFYKKYLNGNKQEVWHELISSNNTFENEDIKLIMDYFINGFKQNIQIIDEILKTSEYVFVDSNDGNTKLRNKTTYCWAKPNILMELDQLQSQIKEYGHFPKIFTEIYKCVDFVNFEGYFTQWRYNFLPDPFVLMPFDIIKYFLELPLRENDQIYVPFSPNALVKDNTSSDGFLYGIFLLKQENLDGYLVNYNKTTLFSDYIRNSFKWGGFPGLEFENIPKNDKILPLIKQIRKEMVEI